MENQIQEQIHNLIGQINQILQENNLLLEVETREMKDLGNTKHFTQLLVNIYKEL